MTSDFQPEFMKHAIALSRHASIEGKTGGVFWRRRRKGWQDNW
jgi:hypothetical protein